MRHSNTPSAAQSAAGPGTSAPTETIPAIPPIAVLPRLAALKSASIAELKRQWRELCGTEPQAFNRAFLESRLAYRIQELAFGGLRPDTIQRLETLGEQLDGGNIALRRIRASDGPIAGTRLVREHQGVQHTVTVLPDGYEYEGRPYRSLSAIARHITGTRWNGWSFFGLKGQRGQV
jgi:hypothetical protein